MKYITDADNAHAKRICKDFEIKKLGEYHDFYVQSDTLLLTDVCENFRNLFLKIYKLDPKELFSAPGLAWQAYILSDILIFLEFLNIVTITFLCIHYFYVSSIFFFSIKRVYDLMNLI